MTWAKPLPFSLPPGGFSPPSLSCLSTHRRAEWEGFCTFFCGGMDLCGYPNRRQGKEGQGRKGRIRKGKGSGGDDGEGEERKITQSICWVPIAYYYGHHVMFLCFWLHHAACGILVSQPGIEYRTSAVKAPSLKL